MKEASKDVVVKAMSKLGTNHLDILKLDVEGSEIEIFQSGGSWLDRVDVIIVELHDQIRPGCREALEKAVHGHKFKFLSEDHITILSKLGT